MFFVSDSSESSSDEESKQQLRLQRKVMGQRSEIFDLPDSKFVEYFRLNKTAFKLVLDKIAPLMKQGVRSTFICNTLKLATTLRFLAQGSYQLNVGNDFKLGLSQPTVSALLAETLDVLEAVICPLFIKFEMSEAERAQCKLEFLEKTGFPDVIGCVAGTHIKILAPSKTEQNLYYNSEGFYSLNAMIICDHKMFIRFLDARYAGSTHDSLVWDISLAKEVLSERYKAGERNCWLLGTAGYSLEPYLMTPYRSAQEGSPEAIFNSKHAKAWNIVESTIVLLKNRFRCLLGARPLHYKPAKATQIVNVCAALHNICITYHINMANNNTPINNSESGENNFEIDNSDDSENDEALEIREEIKTNFL